MARIIITVIISLALIFTGVFIPFIGLAGFSLCALPLAVLACLDGHKKSIAAEILIEIILLLFISPVMAFYFFINSAPIAGVIYLLAKSDKKYSAAQNILICFSVAVLGKLILMIAYRIFTGSNFFEIDIANMLIILNQLYGGDTQEIISAARRVLFIFPHMIPLMVIIYSGIEAFLNYVICGAVLEKYFSAASVKPVTVNKFSDWKFPRSLIFALIIGLVLNYFVDAEEYTTLYFFAVNIQILIDLLLFVQGLSLINWLLDKYTSKNNFLRALIFAMLIILPMMWPFVIIMGMGAISWHIKRRQS